MHPDDERLPTLWGSTLRIAAMTLRDLVHRRALLLLIALAGALLLVGLGSTGGVAGLDPSQAADQRAEMTALVGAIGELLVAAMMIVLGSSVVAGDVRDGTLALVLSRPVRPLAYLAGRALGCAALGLVAAAVVGSVTVGLAARWGLEIGVMYQLGVLTIAADALLLSALSVALGAHLRPVVAGVLACLLGTGMLARAAELAAPSMADVVAVLGPAGLPPSWRAGLFRPDAVLGVSHLDALLVLLDGVAYGALALVLAWGLWRGRDVAVRGG